MDYISTTELRTKSSKLVETLREGRTVYLVHRSQVIGEISPKGKTKSIDAQKFKEAIKELRPSKPLTLKRREEIYQAHIDKKYGKDISRR